MPLAPALVARTPLVEFGATESAPLPLVFHDSKGESRPAFLIEAGTTLTLQTHTAGQLRFGVAADGEPTPGHRLLVTVPGRIDPRFEVDLANTGGWHDQRATAPLSAGTSVVFESDAPVWIANPRTETSSPGAGTSLVVVILIDTIRADHTFLGDYPIPTTPALERLASMGVGFTRAYSTASWTRPATASLLTGLVPEHHRAIGRFDVLPEELTTFAEIASVEGYRTVAFSANPNILPIWGFGQGFDRFFDADSRGWPKKDKGRDATWVFNAALGVIDEEELPLFLYLHVLDPHHPYTPPIESVRDIYPDERIPPGKHGPPPLVSAIRLYDGEIRHTDNALGRFLEALDNRELLDSAGIVVVGDHGEEFEDHASYYHGRTLYEEQLRVPLVLKLPGLGGNGERNDELASIADVLPTVIAELGWSTRPDVDGLPLGPLVRTGEPLRDQLTASLQVDTFRAHALISKHEKLIRHVTPIEETLLYDLRADPTEQHPLADNERLAVLADRLESALAGDRAGWHLLVCGGASLEQVELVVSGSEGPARELYFEADDRVLTRHDGFEIVFRVGPVTRVRESMGKRVEVEMRDEDEVVFSGVLPTIELISPDDAIFVLAGKVKAWSGARSMDPVAARTSAGDPSRCDPENDLTAVQAWYVEAPEKAATAEPDDALRDRLRALGYLE